MLTDSEIKNLKGLSQSQAETIIKNEGYNELPGEKDKKIWHIMLEVLKEPMLLLLIACSAIYFTLGDIHEALILFSFVFVIIGITIYQENKTEKALFALRSLASPRALVIRGGINQRIAGREVVRGDYAILNEGDRVPADGIILWSLNLFIDESILTGESMPVAKTFAPAEQTIGQPGGNNTTFAFSGTLITSGQGIMLVKRTGLKTEMGKIGNLLNVIKEEKTPLQQEAGRIVKMLSLVGISLSMLAAITYFLRNGDFIQGLLAGLTLAMAILPEEFPVIMAIFLALGAWRISKNHVLTRKMNAVESLGSTTVMCIDKTGTLTMNKMEVEKIFALNGGGNGSNMENFYSSESKGNPADNLSLKKLTEYGYLSCKMHTFDPLEIAIHKFSEKFLESGEIGAKYEFLREYPLSHELMAISNAWINKNDNSTLIATKGAPEAIAELCHLDAKQKENILQVVKSMATENLRILAVAEARYGNEVLPDKMHDFDFKFVGLLGLADPIRLSVPEAIRASYAAGIKIIMITGDYPETAKNIAKQIGLKNPEHTITGEEFDAMSDRELIKQLQQITVFSRMVPTQKLRIVNALKASGEIVAMTGDGVNDAPALKSAHIGIAMGKRGTDVSREAADIVLLNDNFSTLVESIKVGRRIYDNLKKAVTYVISIHIPIAGLTLIPIILKWPLILYPVHVVFLELIIDPACSILFEAEPAEKNVMNRPPRDQKKSLLDKRLLALSLAQGISILSVVTLVFMFSYALGKNENQARALTFTTLIFANFFLIFSNRSWSQTIPRSLFKKNPTVWWIIGGAFMFLFMINFLPVLNNIFKFSPLNLPDSGLAMFLGLFSIVWYEFYKLIKINT